MPMLNQFLQKIRLAISDPRLVGRILHHRSDQLLKMMLGREIGSQRLELQLDTIMSDALGGRRDAGSSASIASPLPSTSTLAKVGEHHPVQRNSQTYNPDHPSYRAKDARNFPGLIFNPSQTCGNRVYQLLSGMAMGKNVPAKPWEQLLTEALAEAACVPVPSRSSRDGILPNSTWRSSAGNTARVTSLAGLT